MVKYLGRLRKELSFFRGNYLVLIISWILMDFARELPGTYYSDFVILLGGSPTILGFITLSSMLASASVQFPGGYLADKYGRRWLVSTLTFGVAVSYILYAVAPTWHFILIGAVLGSVCLLYQPALSAMFQDSLPPDKRGLGFSIWNLIMSVSTTPAPVVALMLVTTFGSESGMRLAYFIVTVLFLIAAFVRLKLKESIENVERMNLNDALRSYPKAIREGIHVWKELPQSALFLFVSSIIWRFSFMLTMNLLLVYAFYVLQIGGIPNPALPPQQDPALILARERWGYVIIALFASMIVLSIPAGKIIDKVGRKPPLILSGLLMIPSTLLFVYGDYSTLFLSMILSGLAQIFGMSSFQALMTDLVPQINRGKVTGSMNFFGYIFMAFGGFLGGLLYDIVSPLFPFLLVPLLVVPAILLVAFRVHEPKPAERQV